MGYKYQYDGPVMTFGTYRGTFKGETFANSEERAKANIAYQAKIAMNIASSAKVELPGELKIFILGGNQ